MNGVVTWCEYVLQFTGVAPSKATARPPFVHETKLRLHPLYAVVGTAVNVKDVTQAYALVPGKEANVYQC
jgi:hypothetical protein